MKFLRFTIALLLTSCTTGVSLKSVNYDHLFHDSNSKVWLVNKVLINNAVISPGRDIDKHLLIFYRSGHIYYIPFRDLTRKEGRRGYYTLDSENRRITLEFSEHEQWKFDLAYLTEDSILMIPTPQSDTNISLQIIPFPEL